jgi:hypothetical protein
LSLRREGMQNCISSLIEGIWAPQGERGRAGRSAVWGNGPRGRSTEW